MQDLKEDRQKGKRSDEDVALTGAALVFQIPSLIDKIHALARDVARIDSEVLAYKGLPEDVSRLSATVELALTKIEDIENCLNSIPGSITELSTKIDANSKIATDTAALLQDKVLGPSEKAMEFFKKWAIDLVKKSVYLFGLLIAALYYDAANTISEMIKAAL